MGKISKKILGGFLSVFLLMEMCTSAFAIDLPPDGFDTLSISMDKYYANTKASAALLSADSDEDTIRKVCETFLAVGRASVRSPEYSVATLSDLSQTQVKFRQSEYQYLSALYNAENVIITNDNIIFSNFEAEIDGTSSLASIVEKYTYYTNDFDGYNFRMRKYTFSLNKQQDGSWIITGITTDDPWESTNFSYKPYSIADAAIIAGTSIPVNAVISESDRFGGKSRASTASLYKWTYSTSAAVEYASRFCSATSAAGGNNPLFPFTYSPSGNEANCQNFASQCVWAGLIGDCDTAVAMTTRTALPAVTASRAGDNATNVWSYDDGYTSEYDGYPWISSTRFAKMLKRSSTAKEGPFGNTHYGNLNFADVGDVIHIKYDNTTVTEDSILDHAMFVTSATGSVGSRTVSNLKIAANSSPTNTAYVSLTSYAKGYTDKSFSTCVIGDGYYSSPRNFN